MQTSLARTLYDNKAELPHELSFQKGELVTVLEQNPRGYDGWWICNIRGKVGIVPGNRLMLLGAVKMKAPNSSKTETSSSTVSLGSCVSDPRRPQLDLSSIDFIDSDLPSSGPEPSTSSSSNNRSSADSGVDVMPTASSRVQHRGPNNTVPGPAMSTTSRLGSGKSAHSVRFKDETPTKKSSPLERLLSSDRRSQSLTSDDGSILNTYSRGASGPPSTSTTSSTAPSTRQIACVSPLQQDTFLADSQEDREALEEDQVALLSKKNGLQRIDSLHASFTAAASQLFRFIRIDWKTCESLQNSVKDLRLVCTTLRFVTRRFLNYVRQIVHHVEQRNNHTLVKKISLQWQPLRENALRFGEALQKLSTVEWRAEVIADLSLNPATDYLSEVINSTRNISIQVRALTTVIHANAAMIFGTMVHSSSSENVMHAGATPTPSTSLLPFLLQRGGSSTHNHNNNNNNNATNQVKPRPPVPGSLVSTTPSTATTNNSGESTPGVASSVGDGSIDLGQYRVQLNSQYQLFDSTVREFIEMIHNEKPADVLVTYSKFLLKCGTQMLSLSTEACRGSGLSREHPWRRHVEETMHITCDELKRMIHLTKSCALRRAPTPAASTAPGDNNSSRLSNTSTVNERENLILCVQYVAQNFAALLHAFRQSS